MDYTQLSDTELQEAVNFHRRQRNMSRSINEAAHMRQTQIVRLLEAEEARRLEEAKKPVSKDAVIKLLVKYGNNPETAKKITEKEFASAIKAHPEATASKIAEVIRVVAEEVEQIDELSTEKKMEYGKAAFADYHKQSKAKLGKILSGNKDTSGESRKIANRLKGISTASKTEEVELDEAQSMSDALKNALSKPEPGSKLHRNIQAHNNSIKYGSKLGDDNHNLMTKAPTGHRFDKKGMIRLGEEVELDENLGKASKKMKFMFNTDPRDVKQRIKDASPEFRDQIRNTPGKLGGPAELQRRLARKMKEEVEAAYKKADRDEKRKVGTGEYYVTDHNNKKTHSEPFKTSNQAISHANKQEDKTGYIHTVHHIKNGKIQKQWQYSDSGGKFASYNDQAGQKTNIHEEVELDEAAKIACVKCDEVATAAAWKKNNGTCPHCKKSTQGVAESVEEATMTPTDMKQREKNVKGMKKSAQDFKDRYGSNWKSVMYATATKAAMNEEAKLDK